MRPSIQFRLPPAWYFEFPPPAEPPALPPPTDARTFASLFPINPTLYNGALDYKVPITIATVYAVTVIFWNKINRDRGYKPFAFSQTKAFKTFVIAHNVFLAIFSALTFIGMIRALAHTWPGREHHLFGKFWPGIHAENSVAGAADALCKMHGPRGFGSAVTYNPLDNSWASKDKIVQLAAGLPDGSDVGRLWNEGLAFWGWWFYLSKFYEVFDTFIILSKGKRSSTLQTYHHTGAMMCMWAGIRYMSPPIWMFCFLNSGIHAMMYVYYTLSALNIRVPQRVKRTLTTMQISQFIIGITFAAMHLFVTYTVPATFSNTVTETVDNIASSMVAGVSSAAATVTSAGVAAWLKQAALRAAGEEGLAENVLRDPSKARYGSNPGSNPDSHPSTTRSQTRYRSGYETVPCIDTAGQAFAIYLNLFYLAPLTILFMRFFVKSYLNRGSRSQHPTNKQRITKSIKDAAHGTDREFDKLGKTAEDSVGDLSRDVNGHGKAVNGKSHSNPNETPKSRRVSSNIEKKWERFEKGENETPESTGKSLKRTASKKLSEKSDNLRRMFEEGKSTSSRPGSPSAERKSRRSSSETKQYADDAVEKLEDKASAAVQKAKAHLGTSQDGTSTDAIAEEDEAIAGSEVEPLKKDDLEDSYADVGQDAYPKPSHKEEEPAEESEDSKSNLTTPTEDRRPSTPDNLETARSNSPKKSNIPKPVKSGPAKIEIRSPRKKERARESSPVKKNASSSIPRPSSSAGAKNAAAGEKANNGTEAPSSEKKTTSSGSSSTTTKESETEKEKKSKKDESSATSHSTDENDDDDEGEEKDSATSVEKDTNEKDEQAPSSSTDESSAERGLTRGGSRHGEGKETTSGSGDDRLRWRHTNADEGGEGEGKDEGKGVGKLVADEYGAKVKQGMSFAEAVKEEAGVDGDDKTVKDGGQADAEGNTEISID